MPSSERSYSNGSTQVHSQSLKLSGLKAEVEEEFAGECGSGRDATDHMIGIRPERTLQHWDIDELD